MSLFLPAQLIICSFPLPSLEDKERRIKGWINGKQSAGESVSKSTQYKGKSQHVKHADLLGTISKNLSRPHRYEKLDNQAQVLLTNSIA